MLLTFIVVVKLTNNITNRGLEIRLYRNVADNKGVVGTEGDIYDKILNDEGLKDKTLVINQEAQKNGKSELYSDLKRRTLPACSFGYNVPRFGSGNKSIKHSTNLLCLDLDDNTPEELDNLRKIILSGALPFLRSSGISASYPSTKSFWANAHIELTTFCVETHKELANLLLLKAGASDEYIMSQLKSSYYDYIMELIDSCVHGVAESKNECSDFKLQIKKLAFAQLRCLVHDSDLYINFDSTKLTLDGLLEFEKGRNREVGNSHDINKVYKKSSSSARNCLRELDKEHDGYLNKYFPEKNLDAIFTANLIWIERKGRMVTPNITGSRNADLMVLSRCMAKFGIPIDMFLEFALENFTYDGDLETSPFPAQEIRDNIQSNYRAVRSNGLFGKRYYIDNDLLQEFLLACQDKDISKVQKMCNKLGIPDMDEAINFMYDNLIIKTETHHIQKGKRLSNVVPIIDSALEKHRKIELIAGTGVGKSYASNKDHLLPEFFRRRKGGRGKVVVVNSLNTKAASDGNFYNNFVFTGEAVKAAEKDGIREGFYLMKGVTSTDKHVILTNQVKVSDVVSAIKKHCGEDTPILLIVDEVHTLTKRYRQTSTKNIFQVIDSMNEDSEVIMQTGTPKDYFDVMGYHRLKFTSERSSINVEVRRKHKNFEVDLIDLCRTYPKTDNVLIVKLNDKKALDNAKEMFIANQWLNEDEIIVIHSDISTEDKAKFVKMLDDNPIDSFPSHVHLVLCTSIIGEGVDIQSKSRNAITVNFEKTGLFEVDALVQFLDRVRVSSDTKKKAIFYAPNTNLKKRNFSGFIPKLEYQTLEKQMQDIANTFTQLSGGERFDSYSGAVQLHIKGYSSLDSGEMLRWDDATERRIPDVVMMMIEVEEAQARRCTTMEGFEYIERVFPYIQFDTSEYDTLSDIDKEILDLIEEHTKLLKKEQAGVSKRFKSLLSINSNIALQCVLLSDSNDIEFSMAVNGVNKLLLRSAKEVLEKNADIFSGRHLTFIKEISLNYLELQHKAYLQNDDAISIMFKTNDKFSKANIKEFKESAAIQHHNLAKAIHIKEFGEIKAMPKEMIKLDRKLACINKLPFGVEMTTKEFEQACKKVFRNNRDLRVITETEAKKIVKSYCEVETSTRKDAANKSVKVHKVVKVLEFEDFQKRYSLSDDYRKDLEIIIKDSLVDTQETR